MIINLYELAKKYSVELADFYFKDCTYNGTISNCRRYLASRMAIAEERKDDTFITLVKKMLDGGLVKFTKNTYEIVMLTDNTGFVDNTAKCNRVVWFTIYSDKKVAYDYPYDLPKYIKAYIEKLAKNS